MVASRSVCWNRVELVAGLLVKMPVQLAKLVEARS